MIKTFKNFNSIEIGDNVITNLNIKTSPFHNIKGKVVEITGNDYLLDLSTNGEDFLNMCKENDYQLYGCDWNKKITKTCKWFEKEQLKLT